MQHDSIKNVEDFNKFMKLLDKHWSASTIVVVIIVVGLVLAAIDFAVWFYFYKVAEKHVKPSTSLQKDDDREPLMNNQ